MPRGGKITAVPRGGSVVTRLYERELRAHLYGEERPRAAVKITHETKLDLAGAVDVVYLDPSPSKDFHAGNQTAEKTVGFAFDRETLTFPIVGDADTAHAVGMRYLDALHLAAKPGALVCGFGKRHLIPTDIVEVELEDSTVYTYRLTQKQADLQGMVKFGVVPERPSIYGQAGAGVSGRGGDVLIIRQVANTLLVVADSVPVRQEDAGSLVCYAAACPVGGGLWPGYHLNKLDQNGEYERVGGYEEAATLGVVETASNSAALTGYEATRSFVVKLYSGSLESRTLDEVRAERVNLALYGSGNRWEVLQFLSVTPQAPATPFVAQYLVTGVVGGLYGTEHNSATHAGGDYFVLVDSRVKSFPMRPADITLVQTFVGQTAGQALGDAESVSAYTFTFEGNSRKPLAPARVELDPDTGLAPRDSAGSIAVTVWPRTNADLLGDEYLIEFLSDDRSQIVHSMPFGEGTATVALFKSWSAGVGAVGGGDYLSVSENTLAASGDDAWIGPSAYAVARSLQRVQQAGNYVEGTLRVGTAGDVAALGFISEGRDWHNPGLGADYYLADYLVRLVYAGGDYALSVSVGGADVFTLTGVSAAERVRLLLSGTEVRFYRDWQGPGTPPVYVSSVAPGFPLRAWARLGFLQSGVTTQVEKVIMTTDPLPTTIFSAAQQQHYYGTLKNPVQVNIRQHSGVREAGYGPALGGAI